MPSLAFDAFVAIDWSGAKGPGYRGIAVARCGPGRSAPDLVRPPGARWRREDVLRFLLARPPRERWLVGIDMAFALPEDFPVPPALWAAVEARCAADADLLGVRFAEGDPRFWSAGKRPPTWLESKRRIERVCADAGLGRPETPLKLLGAKQVGRGSLAGARLLHRLREGERWSIWPFDGAPDGRSVCVEIYPRLFIREAGGGGAKLRTKEDLDRVLAFHGCGPARFASFDDHEADALVSAAGLRRHAADPRLWSAGLGEPRGWIFGVPPVPRRE